MSNSTYAIFSVRPTIVSEPTFHGHYTSKKRAIETLFIKVQANSDDGKMYFSMKVEEGKEIELSSSSSILVICKRSGELDQEVQPYSEKDGVLYDILLGDLDDFLKLTKNDGSQTSGVIQASDYYGSTKMDFDDGSTSSVMIINRDVAKVLKMASDSKIGIRELEVHVKALMFREAFHAMFNSSV